MGDVAGDENTQAARAARDTVTMLGLPTHAIAAATSVLPILRIPASLALAETPAGATASAPPVFAPAVILVLCILAGVGTVLLLPSRRDISFRRIGGALLAAAGLMFATLLARNYFAAGIGIYFWLFAGIALCGAVRVITHPRPVYAALYFVLTVFASAGLFVLLDAEFMAAALVVIYAGAILITYVFVIMLAAQARAPGGTVAYLSEYDTVSREPFMAVTVGFALAGVMLFVIFDRAGQLTARAHAVDSQVAATKFDADGNTQRLGVFLFQQEAVQLELAGVILTVSMVGAIVIARKRVIVAEPEGGRRPDLTVAPMTPITDSPYSIPVYGTDNPRQKAYPET